MTAIIGSTNISRPQPVGILPIPAGLLILPGQVGFEADALQQCMQGRALLELPPAWSFYASAAQGDFEAALQRLGEEGQNSPETRYNRFVLQPSVEDLALLRQSLTGDLRLLLEIAAYVSGLEDNEPAVGNLDGELRALALMTQAAAAIEREETSEAIDLLHLAVEGARNPSPVFAVQLLAQMAALRKTQPEPLRSQARKHYKEAIELLIPLSMPELLADLWMQLGVACQESAQGRESWMSEAVQAYQQVLRGEFVPEEHRELFALAHSNLGLLFLTMPMNEAGKQLRMGIAVQSFREGLRLCDRQSNPDLWASIQSNLANALQYLPSSHPEENLAQAVELYEELVSVGRKAFDPVGYGKILSNQANALAHLGIFSPALEKLQEARKLFEWHNETELANNTLDQVAHIHEQIGALTERN
jgi:tetratricopeptide (TPR) repeat protein